ncbi:PHP domain-containing protein [Legionella israelensis]|uniref:PHP domain-containing protein n=1 Tax=Legionella israelensis TaxID=454 RepID=A0AAX1EGG5_9GAMM|nr:PHP domain-containing protein [Legionella israelensis]QBR84220.1 PHP domain-containing protein [Legionella israelensis]
MIDLHCHSYYSDGINSPNELIEKASVNGVKYLAITDHDTTEGIKPFQQSLIERASDITLIKGIELSVSWKKHVIHILGLHLMNHEKLDDLIYQQNQQRIQRAKEISSALALSGLKDAYRKACEIAGHERVARPHFAQVLINEGMAKDMVSAFKKFLGRGRKAYVPTFWINIKEAVDGILDAGGQAVIAHPLKYGLTRTKLYELITDFKRAGGTGLEVVSGDMTKLKIQEAAAICQRFDLLASSGSDYHGEGISRISVGRQQQLPLNCTPIWNEWNF